MTMNWTVTTSFGTRPPTYGDFIGLAGTALSGDGRRSSGDRNSPEEAFMSGFLLYFGFGDRLRLQLGGILPGGVLTRCSTGIDKPGLYLQECVFPEIR